MAGTNGRIDFAAAQPQLDGVTRVDGLDAPVTVRRDGFGIAHIRAENEHDAWFGMGYAAAQDRLWQMDYDRRRATGRWAEVAGGAAVAEDILARRLQLAEAAQVDVASMSASTRGMFEAYAAGSERVSGVGTAAAGGVRAHGDGTGAVGAVALGGRVQDPPRVHGQVAVEDGSGGAAGADRPGALRAARWSGAGGVAGDPAAGRGAGAVHGAARGGFRNRGRATGPARGRRGWLELVGGAWEPDDHRAAGVVQRLPPAAGGAQRLLAGARGLSGVRRDRGGVRRAAGLPALRAQRPGGLVDHAHGGGLSGPVHRTVRPGPAGALPNPRGVVAGRGAERDDCGAGRGAAADRCVADGARAAGVRGPARGAGAGAALHGHRRAVPGLRGIPADARGGDGGGAVRVPAGVGGPGQQLRGGGHDGEHRLHDAGPLAGAVVEGRAAVTGAGVDGRARMGGERAVRGDATGGQPTGGIHRHGEPGGAGRRTRRTSRTSSARRRGRSGSWRC